jgi:hypothetical protein
MLPPCAFVVVPNKEPGVRLSREHYLVVAVVVLQLWHSVLALVWWWFPKRVPFVDGDEDHHIVEQKYDHDGVVVMEEEGFDHDGMVRNDHEEPL